MKEEYNRDTNPYPSFGKKYNSERAIISLTSWKARISTVSKTLYSLLTQCKGFHIVLVLSEEEFPGMLDELPEDIKLLVEHKLIELLFVYYNYRSFKKVLWTMNKYRDVPIISADDDCIYTCNYAKMLYNTWTNNRNACIGFSCGYRKNGIKVLWGYAQLFPPGFSSYIDNGIMQEILKHKCIDDDDFYTAIRVKNGIDAICLNRSMFSIVKQMPSSQHNSISKERTWHKHDMAIYNRLLALNI